MQVYKLFLKILNKHKGLMLMYVGIYLGITMIVSGQAKDNAVPMTNYGIAIAHMHGILKRSLAPFPDALNELK